MAAAQGQAHHHIRQLRPQILGIALAAHLRHLGCLVGVGRGLEICGVLRGNFRQGVGLELVQNVVGGGFQRGTADVYVGANAVFGKGVAVADVFDFGLALDVMDFGQQHLFGGGLGAGFLLGVGDGFGRAAGVLAHCLQISPQLGHEIGRDDLVVLDFGKGRGIAGHAVNGVGVADFGELVFVEETVVFWGFGGGCGCGCRIIAHSFYWEFGVGSWKLGMAAKGLERADMSAPGKRRHVAAVHASTGLRCKSVDFADFKANPPVFRGTPRIGRLTPLKRNRTPLVWIGSPLSRFVIPLFRKGAPLKRMSAPPLRIVTPPDLAGTPLPQVATPPLRESTPLV